MASSPGMPTERREAKAWVLTLVVEDEDELLLLLLLGRAIMPASVLCNNDDGVVNVRLRVGVGGGKAGGREGSSG